MTEQPQHAPDEAEPLEPVTGEPGWADDEPEVPAEPEEFAEPAERVRTGVERVDEVIRAVEELEERPVEEHVGVFESAQVQLRKALDDAGDDRPGGGDGPVDGHGGDHGDHGDHAGHA